MKKKEIALLAVLFAFVLAGTGIFLGVRWKYHNTGLARFQVLEEAYTYNGKLLISQDGENALQYQSTERVKFHETELVTVDLTPYGFEGETFSYFLYNGWALCPDEGYEGFWPVSTKERFLYRSGDGIYQIRPDLGKSYPVFADSVEGVPENGGGVLAFSSNGSYAVALDGDTVTVYHTDPYNDSLRIVDYKTVDLTSLGEEAAFVAFTSEIHAVFSLHTEAGETFAVVDCSTGEAVLSPTDLTRQRGEVLNRFFAQRSLNEAEREEYCAAWTNLLLGTDTLCKGEVEGDLTLFVVSPQGKYAVARQDNAVWILSEKRAFSLSDILEGERVLAVDFLYENVIAVSVLRDDVPMTYCYTVLF